ncbi:hypothetical protein C0995_014250 [Termitomyces sp. Mi166|nr:hypothetical protein C0995_014250 [Termitomyces sp. Mi166\
MDSDAGSPMLGQESFGLPLAYLWGNLPAIDCLNLSKNEGMSKSAAIGDLKICFAASGDLRNLIRTVNCLPAEYDGRCDILFNDFNSLVVGHNIVVLWVLLNPDLATDDAAEFALHLMYSSMLTPAMSNFLSRSLDIIDGLAYRNDYSIDINGRGTLNVRLARDDLDITIEMLQSKYGQRAAMHAYSKIMCNPRRQDYTDRYLNSLEPAHRLSFTHYRSSGVLAPFSLDTSNFEEPNRLLYSSRGDWLLRDSDSPLHGWDMSLVFAHGEKCGLNRADSYGCLFFYLKNELSSFAKRLRDCRINITVTMFDATILPSVISSSSLKPFSPGCFDRIETSNLADYLSAPRILRDWAQFLNHDNKFAAILINFMNWQKHFPVLPDKLGTIGKQTIDKYASIMGVDVRNITVSEWSNMASPILVRFYGGLCAFTDDHEQFQSFLRDQSIEKFATHCGVRLRNVNRVHPKRAGAPMDSPRLTIPSKLTKSEFYNTYLIGGSESMTRFVEFELGD